MFTLNRIIARDSATDLDDTANTKFALTALGYHDDSETGLAPYADDDLFESIRRFQEDHGLTVDGIMKPLGETVTRINEKLKELPQTQGAFTDFVRNRQDMIDADTIGADKYFHCKANYEAASRGELGEMRAEIFSASREVFGEAKSYYERIRAKDAFEDMGQDLAANYFGREAAKSGKFSSSAEACAIFRPEGLDEKY